MTYLLALDQGTSSSRSIVFDAHGHIVAQAQQELPQIYPQPGWVEHDPMLIWRTQLATARQALAQAGIAARDVRALGITNQRETTVLWNRKTGEPVHHAIVWQDRRAEPACAQLRAQGHADAIQAKTGLLIDAYFSGTKLQWLLDNVPGARAAAERGELAFGTVDSWLIWQLTGGQRHVTDVSNASRTMLLNVHTNQWDDELLALLRIPRALLPEVLPSSGDFGRTDAGVLGACVAIGGVAGDQQSALFGQACFKAGMAKNTYGTGCFTLMNTGPFPVASSRNLLSTVAWDLGKGYTYALEGSVFVAGAVIQWLRDQMEILPDSSASEALARSVPDTGGVYLVPAFVGLGAPYWDSEARGTIVGITRGTTRAHLVRAALEAIAYESRDLLDAMEMDSGRALSTIKADGGASANSFLMQVQADITDRTVVLPEVAETTALGAAYMAGLAMGYWTSLDDVRKNWRKKREFRAEMASETRSRLVAGWDKAVAAARSYKP